MSNLTDVQEFRTTWNNELFLKNRSTIQTARRLIRKSWIIIQLRSYRQLKYMQDDLAKELQAAERDRDILQNSLANHLQERLNVLQNQMNEYKQQMNDLVRKEKEYWKQLEQTIAKRINLRRPSTNPSKTCTSRQSNPRPLVVVNATFVMHVNENNENLPPIDTTTPAKVPKIRSKKKARS